MKEHYSSIEPFPFVVIDDVLPPDLLKEVKDYAYSKLPFFETGIHQHIIRSGPLQDRLEETFIKISERYGKALFLDLATTDGFIFQLSCYNTVHTNYTEYEIHNDVPTKIASLIIGLSDDGNLTEIYGTRRRDSFVYSPDWKPNRGIMFKRSDNSWHKVGEPLGTPRVTLSMIRIR
jgi:hypothetical protein